jgi:putative hemolysin
MTLALFLAGIVFVAVLTAGATAVRSVSRIWLRHWVEQRLTGNGAPSLSIDGVQRLLLAAGTAVALVAFATGAVLGTQWAHSPLVLVERLAIATFLMLGLGQLVPRAVARRWAPSLMPVLVPPLRIISAVFAPLVSAAQVLAGARQDEPAAAPGGDERQALEELLREGELEGVGDAGESAIITGVVDFAEKRVRDVMTPRDEIFAIERSVPVNELMAQVAHAKYSRVPITDGGIDHVVGTLHTFHVLKWESGVRPDLHPVVFAQESTVASELLFRMLHERVHLAIIQDSSLRTVGLVALEDLFEELVGDIRDEHDEPTG